MASTDLGTLKTNIDTNVTNQTTDDSITPALLGAQMKAMAESAMNPAINTRTANYVLVLTDNGKYVRMNVASANTLTVPLNSSVAFPVGTTILIRQVGAGTTTIVATGGVTINAATLEMSQYAGASLIKVATNEWDLFLGAAEAGLTQLATPTLTATVISSTQIDLSWTNVANESSYLLQSSPDNSTWTTIDSPAANVTTYSNTGLTPSTLYYYRIKAVGDGVTYSDSNYGTDSDTTSSGGASYLRVYSLRKIVAGYTGYAVKLRRVSDDVEQDIGFSGSDFDTAAATTFIGGSSAMVVTWYDQSGLGQNATQATTANQPNLNLTGFGGHPAVAFDFSNDFLNIPAIWSGGQTRSFVAVYKLLTATGTLPVFGQTGAAGSLTWFQLYSRTAGATGHPYLAVYAGDLTDNTTPDTTDGLVASGTYDGTTLKLRRNGTEIDSGVVALNTTTTTCLIGKDGDGAVFSGFISEIIVPDTSATPTTLEADAATYYSI